MTRNLSIISLRQPLSGNPTCADGVFTVPAGTYSIAPFTGVYGAWTQWELGSQPSLFVWLIDWGFIYHSSIANGTYRANYGAFNTTAPASHNGTSLGNGTRLDRIVSFNATTELCFSVFDSDCNDNSGGVSLFFFEIVDATNAIGTNNLNDRSSGSSNFFLSTTGVGIIASVAFVLVVVTVLVVAVAKSRKRAKTHVRGMPSFDLHGRAAVATDWENPIFFRPPRDIAFDNPIYDRLEYFRPAVLNCTWEL
jgi:hypothetical protein